MQTSGRKSESGQQAKFYCGIYSDDSAGVDGTSGGGGCLKNFCRLSSGLSTLLRPEILFPP